MKEAQKIRNNVLYSDQYMSFVPDTDGFCPGTTVDVV